MPSTKNTPSKNDAASRRAANKKPKANASRTRQHKQGASRRQTAQRSVGKTASAKPLHPRNIHKMGYNFEVLMAHAPQLKPFVRPSPFGALSIDFADPQAVKCLNAALLSLHYGIHDWDIPDGFLCPPVPGRVDYLHYVADLLADSGKIPKGGQVKALDIGTGANGIYPLLGHAVYGWRFVASDIDPLSLTNVEQLKRHNQLTEQQLELRHQQSAAQIFDGIIQPNERFDLTLCNPPFHESLAQAAAGSARKHANLTANRQKKGIQTPNRANASLNFGGQKAELWCDGGEKQFLHNMIHESAKFSAQCLWFSSLVSKKENLKPCQMWLEKLAAQQVQVIDMSQGNKMTRVLAWTFLDPQQRRTWAKFRA
ncbi:23S rRNA (adenine(1618)-N(6))-methyltransferase RlmF [Shewanella gelidii]|nr:23S rRNA (adenine(1618)-N(6))-methyltransferase RlmF [Shewanella gelidii]MCL1098922.1 23S rRNA (adenine(1618)-N(6))-methyltransferase RlmF [Shewanella gelidii]